MRPRHRWEWHRRWWTFWFVPATRRCVRCGAELRLVPAGPRKGVRYFYRVPNWTTAFSQVVTLPPCEPWSVARELEKLHGLP